jgi:3,4-dihydroxy 2-butanone 4-phosphate synthase/GTP cyclohydrolase II
MINDHYSAIIHRVERGLLAAQHDVSARPTTTLAFAQGLDGSISGKTGTRTQLSNPQSQTMTHHLRARHDAILVGINTVLVDDPRLTVRLVDGPSPRPVVVDSSLRLPPRALMMNGGGIQPLIATTFNAPAHREDRLRSAGAEVIRLPADHAGRVDLAALLRCLRRLNIRSLMVEGGAEIITSFLVAGLADRLVLTICPVLLGGQPAINSRTPAHPGKLPTLYEPVYASCDGDLILCANLSEPMNGRP